MFWSFSNASLYSLCVACLRVLSKLDPNLRTRKGHGKPRMFWGFFFPKPLPCSQNITIHLVNVDFHPWSHCSTLWLLFIVFVCIIKTFWMSVVSCMQWLKMHFWRLSIAVFLSVWLWLKIHRYTHDHMVGREGFNFPYRFIDHSQKAKSTGIRESRWKAESGVYPSAVVQHSEGAISGITCPMISR